MLSRDITTYTHVDYTLVIKMALIRVTKTSRLNTGAEPPCKKRI